MSARATVAFILAACLLAVDLPTLALAADDGAGALLAKHAAYAGWQGGDGKIKTLRESGTATRDGKVLSRISELRMGQIYRTSGTQTVASFDSGFTAVFSGRRTSTDLRRRPSASS